MRAYFVLQKTMLGPIRRTVNPHAKRLRRARTDAENKLWQAVRSRQIDDFKFRFQHSIGAYVADFACLEAMLIVEIDGSQHDEVRDHQRTADLEAKGYRLLRFWNNEVLTNLDGVVEVVRAELLRRTVR